MLCKNPRCDQKIRAWIGYGPKPKFCSKACKNRIAVIRRRDKLKQLAVESKGGKCEICGYDKCVRALEFHHKDPTTKEFGLSDARTRSLKKVLAEVAKCILVCSNCHAEIEEEMDKQRWVARRIPPDAELAAAPDF